MIAILYKNNIVKLLNKDMEVVRTILLESSSEETYQKVRISKNLKYLTIISDRKIFLYNTETGKLVFNHQNHEPVEQPQLLKNYFVFKSGSKIKIIKYFPHKEKYLTSYELPFVLAFNKDVRFDHSLVQTAYSQPLFHANSYNNHLYTTYVDNHYNVKIYRGTELVLSKKINYFPNFVNYNPVQKELFITKKDSIEQFIFDSDYEILKVNQFSFNHVLQNLEAKNSADKKEINHLLAGNILNTNLAEKKCKILDHDLFYIDKNNKLCVKALRDLNKSSNQSLNSLQYYNYQQIITNLGREVLMESDKELHTYKSNQGLAKILLPKGLTTQNNTYAIDKSNLQVHVIPDSRISFLKDDVRNPRRPVSKRSLKPWGIHGDEIPIVRVDRYAIDYKDKNYLIKGMNLHNNYLFDFKFKIKDTEKDELYNTPKYKIKNTKRELKAFSTLDIAVSSDSLATIAFSLNDEKTIIVKGLNLVDSMTFDVNNLPPHIDSCPENNLILSPNGEYVALISKDDKVEIYKNFENPLCSFDLNVNSKITRFVNNNYFLTYNKGGDCIVYDLINNGRVYHKINLANTPQQIKDIYYNEPLKRFDCLVQDGTLVSFNQDDEKNWYRKLFLENGNRIIMDNNDYFACDKGEEENIYFVEKNKIIRDSVLFKHYYKPELMEEF